MFNSKFSEDSRVRGSVDGILLRENIKGRGVLV